MHELVNNILGIVILTALIIVMVAPMLPRRPRKRAPHESLIRKG